MSPDPSTARTQQANHGDKDLTEARPQAFYLNAPESTDAEDSEAWLLSYADMVTLLMCFFILFFTLDKSHGGISDPERLKTRLEQLIGLDSAAVTPPSKPNPSKSSSQSSNAAGKTKAKLEEDLAKIAKNLKIVFSLATPNPGLIEITFLNANFFESGQIDLTTPGKAMILKMAPRLAEMGPNSRIEVEGHTDSDQTSGGRYSTNWELSALRAASVVRLLQQEGIPPARLKIAGYGEYHPLVAEKDRRGFIDSTAKKLNRRVVIRVTQEDGADSTTAQRGVNP